MKTKPIAQGYLKAWSKRPLCRLIFEQAVSNRSACFFIQPKVYELTLEVTTQKNSENHFMRIKHFISKPRRK